MYVYDIAKTKNIIFSDNKKKYQKWAYKIFIIYYFKKSWEKEKPNGAMAYVAV